MTDVLVLGGGIAGLASAHRLVSHGHDVTLLEASHQLGGLGRSFNFDGHDLECFYHCTMPSDEDLLALAAAVGVADSYTWRETTMGMVSGQEFYDFNTPLDLLRYTPLPLRSRLRLGLGAVTMRAAGRLRDLDNTSSREWLTSIYGKRLWDEVWFPLFRSKFGEAAGDVPARYIWQRAGREGNKARRGYPPGGYRGLARALAADIEAKGGRILLNAPVESIDADADKVYVTANGETHIARRAISTLPLPLLSRVASAELAGLIDVPDLRYVGVVNALFLTKQSMTGHYWTPVLNDKVEFDGVVEMSTLIGQVEGCHLNYVMRYTDRDSELFSEPDEVIAERWGRQFRQLHGLTEQDVAQTFVFRAPFVEPIWPLGYAPPKARIGNGPVFMATTAQVYPNVTSWNSSTRLANAVVAELEETL